jgi:hypothetical protein
MGAGSEVLRRLRSFSMRARPTLNQTPPSKCPPCTPQAPTSLPPMATSFSVTSRSFSSFTMRLTRPGGVAGVGA